MLKYFEIVMDLLEMDVDRKKYIEIAKVCEENKDKDFLFFHRHAFLFVSFLELVRGEIDLETVMMVGDVEAKDKLASFSDSSSFLEFVEDLDFLENLDGAYLVLDDGILSFVPGIDDLTQKYKFSYLSC